MMGKYEALFEETTQPKSGKYSALFDAEPSTLSKVKEAVFPMRTAAAKSGAGLLKQNLMAGLDVVTAIPRAASAAYEKATELVGKGMDVAAKPVLGYEPGFKAGVGGVRKAVSEATPESIRPYTDPIVSAATDLTTYVGAGAINAARKPLARLASEKMGSQVENLSRIASKEFNTAKRLLSNETGAAKLIPDLDDIPDDLPIEEIGKLGPRQAAKAVKMEAGKVGNIKSPAFSRMDPGEANMISEPLKPRDTDFTAYAVQARKAKANMREMTPMDLAGIKAKKALDEISEARQAFGDRKGKLLERQAKKTIETADVKTKWNQLLNERLGASIDADGNVIDATDLTSQTGTRFMRRPSEATLISQINAQINKLGDVTTIKQADDIKSAIFDLVDNSKASMAKPINTVTEAIGKEIRALIDSKVEKTIGHRYKALNTSYARLKAIETQLSRRLGEVTDAETGQTRMGASLMKSAVMSNSDRGSKALFSAVQKVTGIDLIKDASFAKIAMDAVDDFRATDLLKSMSETKNLVRDLSESQSLYGAVSRVAAKGYEKVRGDKLDELIRFSQRQKAKELGKVKPVKKPVGRYLDLPDDFIKAYRREK